MELYKGARVDVELIDHMGTDASVVNAARVSFGKRIKEMSEGDTKLIRYLAKHNHWSPFGHASVQFRIKAPIFVARQLVKHQVGLTWNEISRRYVEHEPEFYEVDKWRGKPINKKQGSSEEEIEWVDGNEEVSTTSLQTEIEALAEYNYNWMLRAGVAPEQARMILPQSMMTEWYWSGTLYAFARICNLRCAEDAQYETRIVANLIDKECEQLFPISWTELRKT